MYIGHMHRSLWSHAQIFVIMWHSRTKSHGYLKSLFGRVYMSQEPTQQLTYSATDISEVWEICECRVSLILKYNVTMMQGLRAGDGTSALAFCSSNIPSLLLYSSALGVCTYMCMCVCVRVTKVRACQQNRGQVSEVFVL